MAKRNNGYDGSFIEELKNLCCEFCGAAMNGSRRLFNIMHLVCSDKCYVDNMMSIFSGQNVNPFKSSVMEVKPAEPRAVDGYLGAAELRKLSDWVKPDSDIDGIMKECVRAASAGGICALFCEISMANMVYLRRLGYEIKVHELGVDVKWGNIL